LVCCQDPILDPSSRYRQETIEKMQARDCTRVQPNIYLTQGQCLSSFPNFSN
jgi:hypothetical protein